MTKELNSKLNFDEARGRVRDETSSFQSFCANLKPSLDDLVGLIRRFIFQFADEPSVHDVRETGPELLQGEDDWRCFTLQEEHDGVRNHEAQRHGRVASRPDGPISAQRKQHT